MSDRATRPLNQQAVSAADDELYGKHADDPRPNALFDANGNRKPLDANDPAQADLRKEWMDSYKANGGETEQSAASSETVDRTSLPCDRRPLVNPVIVGEPVALDDSNSTIDELTKSKPEDNTDSPPSENQS